MVMLIRVRVIVMMIFYNKGGNCWVWRFLNSKFFSLLVLMVVVIVVIDIVDVRVIWRFEKIVGVVSGS